MTDPIIPKGLEGLRMTVPQPDVPTLLVRHACDALEIVGQMTGRQQDAADLVAAIRAKFGG